MPPIKISDLSDGDQASGFALLTKKELRRDRNNKEYLDLELSDASGSIAGKVWSDSPAPTASFATQCVSLMSSLSKAERAAAPPSVRSSQPSDVVLSAPRATGFGLAAYFVPVLAFAAGGLFVWVYLMRQTRARPPGAWRTAYCAYRREARVRAITDVESSRRTS